MVLLILVSPVLPCKWGRLVELSGKCALGLLSLFAIYTAENSMLSLFFALSYRREVTLHISVNYSIS